MLVNANANNLEAVKTVSHNVISLYAYLYMQCVFLSCFLFVMLIMINLYFM